MKELIASASNVLLTPRHDGVLHAEAELILVTREPSYQLVDLEMRKIEVTETERVFVSSKSIGPFIQKLLELQAELRALEFASAAATAAFQEYAAAAAAEPIAANPAGTPS